MKITIRKYTEFILLLAAGVSYYVLFFTQLFHSQIRQFAYLLSGNSTQLSENLALSRSALNVLTGESGSVMFQQYYSSLMQQLQFGPYMNFSVYMLTLFITAPLFLISAFIVKERKRQSSFALERMYWSQFTRTFFNYLFTMFIFSGIGSILSSILAALVRSEGTSANQAAIQNNLQSNFIISIVPIVILAPIIEEIVFRGVLLSSINKLFGKFLPFTAQKKIRVYKNIEFQNTEIFAIVLSAIFFALIHLSSNWNQWVYFPAYFFGGVALGGIYVWNRERLYVPILVHAVYNALPIFLMTIIRLITKGW